MWQSVLDALDLGLEVAKKGDELYHKATGKIDDLIHSGVAKLEALREQVYNIVNGGDPNAPQAGPAYGACGDDGRAWVDSQMEKFRAQATA